MEDIEEEIEEELIEGGEKTADLLLKRAKEEVNLNSQVRSFGEYCLYSEILPETASPRQMSKVADLLLREDVSLDGFFIKYGHLNFKCVSSY